MRPAILVALSITLAGCGGANKPPTAVEQPPSVSAQETVAYIDTDIPTTKLLKVFPPVHDPANDAEDATSCRVARGVWSDSYLLGVLILDHPEQGAIRAGKRCWSKRPPTRFPDAGKPCRGQADCAGNCIAQQQEDGTRSPKCQVNKEDQVCGPVIYDGGRYHSVLCPIP
jgi:hypothetical protein